MEKDKLPEDIHIHPKHKDTTNTTSEEIHDIFGTKLYAISFGVINELMDSDEPFSTQEAIDKIISRWWIARMGVVLTIREYLENLEEELWRVTTDSDTGKHQATEKWPKAA